MILAWGTPKEADANVIRTGGGGGGGNVDGWVGGWVDTQTGWWPWHCEVRWVLKFHGPDRLAEFAMVSGLEPTSKPCSLCDTSLLL